MARHTLSWRLLIAFTVSAAFINGSQAWSAGTSSLIVSAPPGFEDLASERQLVLDVYFGGKRLGEARATISPGSLAFERPDEVAAMIPEVANLPELVSALSGSLPSNVALACGPVKHDGCGVLQPQRAGVILDEQRFRVEIVVHSSLLVQPDASAASYLTNPDNEPSLISLLGATGSGSGRSKESWHVQNRSIASLGNLRLRSDSSLSTKADLTFDNLSLEMDRGDWRYAGGLFWVPGTDLVGRRKIMGLGIATQLDTRQDKTALLGTPLVAFLQQPAKVDILVDGRIVSSRIYPAGNRLIDTTSLPNGSYDVILRIQEDGRPAREERQFFTKGTLMAPLGRPLYSAFAGLLPASDSGLSFKGDTFFYEAAAAYRLNRSWGADATILGTQNKAILEGGVMFHARIAQVRASALVSTSADFGLVLRASSATRGPLSFSFDLRKVHSRDGRALLPVSTSRGTFSEDPKAGFSDNGSYAQALSIIGYRLGQANLRLTGIYRRNGSEPSTTSLGASIEVPVIRSGRFDVLLQGDARKTESDFGSFLGVRLLVNSGNFGFSGSAGISQQSGRSSRIVGEAQAAWSRQLGDQSQLSSDAALGRDQDGSYARASAFAQSSKFNARADLLHQFTDHGDTTQYSATLDSGIVMTKNSISLAGRDMNDTAVIVSATGGDAGQEFDVLVNEVARGSIANGERMAFFLQPYQSYDFRLRPRGGLIADFDMAPRQVTLFPGNVAALDWKFKALFIVFGRAISPEGKPVANADIAWPHGIGRTDGNGYFQIETSGRDELRLTDRDNKTCTAAISKALPLNGYYSAGDIMCR